jgi:formate dehydrogenase major subunit
VVAPKVVTLTIDGQTVQAHEGQTILEAAQSVGIHIPALCHHTTLPPMGACRLCVVEIEKQRVPQPACTFPVADGLVVRTNTPAIQSARLINLNLLFSERSHYCMFCPSSGTAHSTDCELQKLGYDCGITAWPYPPNTAHKWEVDASHPHLLIDHSRCILCRRCVRACGYIAANHTLGVHQRGAKALIGADDGVPLGESSCMSCGVCAELCPTGALVDRSAVFAGHDSDLKWTRSVCTACAVGCGIRVGTRDDRVLKIGADWEAHNGGLLCAAGRFESVETPAAKRILLPRVRQDDTLVEVSWEEAFARAADGFRQAAGGGGGGGGGAAGLVSPRLPGESLAAFACLFQEVLHSDSLSLIYGDTPLLDLGTDGTLADVANADFIAIIGGDVLNNQKVLGYLVKRAYDRGANILVVDGRATALEPYARWNLHLHDIAASAESPFARLRHSYHLNISGLKQLRSAVAAAARPVILYAGGLSTSVYAALRELPAQVRFVPLVVGANTRGAAALGLTTRPVAGQALYTFLGDEMPGGAGGLVPRAIPISVPPRFLLVQAAYESPWTAIADVVLPARLWNEQSGHVVSLDGQSRAIHPLRAAPASVKSDRDVLLGLANQLGHTLNFDEIPGVMHASMAGDLT